MTSAKTPTNQTTEMPTAIAPRRYVMPAVVLGLLGGHMLFIVLVITLSTGDRSFAVVPDYYQKAVDYDERKALLAASAELGWSAQLLPGSTADVMGQREVVLQLRDVQGQPIQGLKVQATGYHLARAGDPVTVSFIEVLPGQYVGEARILKEGFWQFEIRADGADQPFICDVRQFIAAAGGTR